MTGLQLTAHPLFKQPLETAGCQREQQCEAAAAGCPNSSSRRCMQSHKMPSFSSTEQNRRMAALLCCQHPYGGISNGRLPPCFVSGMRISVQKYSQMPQCLHPCSAKSTSSARRDVAVSSHAFTHAILCRDVPSSSSAVTHALPKSKSSARRDVAGGRGRRRVRRRGRLLRHDGHQHRQLHAELHAHLHTHAKCSTAVPSHSLLLADAALFSPRHAQPGTMLAGRCKPQQIKRACGTTHPITDIT